MCASSPLADASGLFDRISSSTLTRSVSKGTVYNHRRVSGYTVVKRNRWSTLEHKAAEQEGSGRIKTVRRIKSSELGYERSLHSLFVIGLDSSFLSALQSAAAFEHGGID